MEVLADVDGVCLLQCNVKLLNQVLVQASNTEEGSVAIIQAFSELIKEQTRFLTNEFKHELTILMGQFRWSALDGIFIWISNNTLGFTVQIGPSNKQLSGEGCA
jgi:hypothetical protein